MRTNPIRQHLAMLSFALLILLEFEPLPLTTMTISVVEVKSEPFGAWGASWSGHRFSNLPVKLLRSNHDAVKAITPKIVK